MRRTVHTISKRTLAKPAAALCLAICLSGCMGSCLQAEESGYFDESGNWVQESYSEESAAENAGFENLDALAALTGDGADAAMADGSGAVQDGSAALTGTYSVEAGWSVDDAASTTERTVYKQDAYVGVENTSTITCSYMDTNYSVLEYEQLRDMLTNNLLYANVNAQISTSAVYTQTKDYLYIVIVDDSALEYKDVYHYVVGDYRCFCVEVREYRAEADQAVANGVKTPHEVGQKTAEEFTWGVA